MSEYPTKAEYKVLVEEIGQTILRTGRDYVTYSFEEFYALVKKHTGKEKFRDDDLNELFQQGVIGGRVPFLIAFGMSGVFVCKDSNFAPVEL